MLQNISQELWVVFSPAYRLVRQDIIWKREELEKNPIWSHLLRHNCLESGKKLSHILLAVIWLPHKLWVYNLCQIDKVRPQLQENIK